MKILYVVNEARFFISHRLPLGLEALAHGFEVVVVTAPETGEQALADYGFRHIAIPLTRSGFTLFQEIASYRALKRIYREEQPDLVHHVTIKPVIYGSLAARAGQAGAVVNAVPGMGFVFSQHGIRSMLLRTGVTLLYRLAFMGLPMRVIFQNTEDLNEFLRRGILRREQTVLIRGSGVDIEAFTERELGDAANTVFVLVARMLREKGVEDFAAAAQRLKALHADWRFLLAGDVDTGNPSSLAKHELEALEKTHGVEWLGQVRDVPALLRGCDVMVLPTYYREGLPKTLLEASAAGLAMVASDIAGCREVVSHEVNGLLVPAHDVDALTQAMQRLGEDPQLRQRYGHAARMKAESVFSIDDVVEHTFRVYRELLDL